MSSRISVKSKECTCKLARCIGLMRFQTPSADFRNIISHQQQCILLFHFTKLNFENCDKYNVMDHEVYPINVRSVLKRTDFVDLKTPGSFPRRFAEPYFKASNYACLKRRYLQTCSGLETPGILMHSAKFTPVLFKTASSIKRNDIFVR